MIAKMSSKGVVSVALTIALVGAISIPTRAQEPIFSFEEGTDPWLAVDASIVQSSFGATHGSSALLIDNITPGYKNTLTRSDNFGPATAGMVEAYNAFNSAASVVAAGRTPKLEFDLTWDFSQVTLSSWFQLGMVLNSQAGWQEYNVGQLVVGNTDISAPTPVGLGAVAENDGVTITSLGPSSARLAIPFGPTKTINLVPNSTYYDIWFKSNGAWEGTIDLAVDNFRITGLPVYEEHTLFSWETPDDPGTPGVNEQFEGWIQNPTSPNPTPITITSTGATDGASALRIDRTGINPPSGFSWGNAFALDATTNPSDQVRIDDFVERINGATQIAIDVTFQDQFPISPSGTRLYLAFIDETGIQYQAGSQSFDLVEAAQLTTQTLTFNVDSFLEYLPPETPPEVTPKNLAIDGLLEGTSTFAILLGTATDDGAVYQIDNFRLISEVVAGVPGDFDGNGVVTGRDFLAWQRNPSLGDLSDWQNAYNNGALVATQSIPEPTTLVLVLMVGAAFLGRGRCAETC